MRFNSLQPSGHYTHNHFNIKHFHVYPVIYFSGLCESERTAIITLTTWTVWYI